MYELGTYSCTFLFPGPSSFSGSSLRQQYALAQQKAAALSSAPLQQQQQQQQQINLLLQQYQALKMRLVSHMHFFSNVNTHF